jgi:hypothetical protein
MRRAHLVDMICRARIEPMVLVERHSEVMRCLEALADLFDVVPDKCERYTAEHHELAMMVRELREDREFAEMRMRK